MSWFLGCFTPASSEPIPIKGGKDWDASSSYVANDESRSRRSVRMLSKLGSSSGPVSLGGIFDSSRIDIEAAAVNAALLKVGTLVQRFANMRQQCTCLKSMQQALTLITEEWPGAFACIHIMSNDMGKALLLAGAMAVDTTPRNSPARPPLAHLPLLALHGTAMSIAQASTLGCYTWHKDDGSPPVDYAPYAASGAQAVSTIVILLPGSNAAALTVGFVWGADATHVSHELWPAYLKVIAAGMSPLILEPSIPQYLSLAVDLQECEHLDDVMVSIVRNMRLLTGQASNMQLWFRVALVGSDATTAVLFDVPSEVTSSLHISRPALSRRMSCSQIQQGTSKAGNSPVATRRRPRPVKSVPHIGLAATRSDDVFAYSSAGDLRSALESSVVRTEVALENTMLKQVIGKQQLAIIPNIQKLINHGGGVAEDIFAVQDIRPPAAMLLLPLVKSTPDVAACTATQGGACFGAVYCMSSVLTDFADIKLRLYESVVKVLSPHLFATLATETLAYDYQQAVLQTSHSLQDLAMSSSRSSAAWASEATDSNQAPAVFNSASPSARDVLCGDLLSNEDSRGLSGRISSPNSYTSALVTGLTDKINSRRLVQSLDLTEASHLNDLQLLGLLGTGGYGLVFRGKWCGMLAAVKLVYCPKVGDEDASKTVLKHAHEIAILSSVSHPNCIQAYGFLTNVRACDVIDVCLPGIDRSDSAFTELLAMSEQSCHIEVLELCDMGSLFDALQRGDFNLPPPAASSSADASSKLRGGSGGGGAYSNPAAQLPGPRLNMQSVLLTLVELASALANLHSLGIVHCDIKPDNVLLKSSSSDERGFTVKLSDFGLSRVQDDDGFHSFPCNSRGTLAYLSPEALSGDDVDESTDVYSFGILMFELFTNSNPFSKMAPDELFTAVVRLGHRPRFPTGANESYVALAHSCWHESASARPSFDQVTNVLKRLLTIVRSRPTSALLKNGKN